MAQSAEILLYNPIALTVGHLRGLNLPLNTPLSSTVPGGQGSLYIKSLKYTPQDKALYLTNDPTNKDPNNPPEVYAIFIGDVLNFPDSTVIYIESLDDDCDSTMSPAVSLTKYNCDGEVYLDFEPIIWDEFKPLYLEKLKR